MEKLPRNATADLLIQAWENGACSTGVCPDRGAQTLWLTEEAMAGLYGCTPEDVCRHVGDIFAEGGLDPRATTRHIDTGRGAGQAVCQYNLDAVIAAGLRIPTDRAAAFRQWTVDVMRRVVIRGHVVDRQRFEDDAPIGPQYFEQLLEEIAEIRLSGRASWQKVTDLFATASDYDPQSPEAQRFYGSMLGRMRRILRRRPATGARSGQAVAAVLSASLTPDESDALDRLVASYLDLAQWRAGQGTATTMQEWEQLLSGFLVFDGTGGGVQGAAPPAGAGA